MWNTIPLRIQSSQIEGTNPSFPEPITEYFDAERYPAFDNNLHWLILMLSIIQKSDRIFAEFGDVLVLTVSTGDFDIFLVLGS